MVTVRIIYLEMLAPPARGPSAPPAPATIEQLDRPAAGLYRSWYRRVGENYGWRDREMLSDEELEEIIQHPRVTVHLLRVDGEPAGYAELDHRRAGHVEIAYFGLFPEFIGRGLGRWFLERVIDIAWAEQPRRVWLHTCTLDHPRALPNYQAAGFTPYRTETVEKEDGARRPA